MAVNSYTGLQGSGKSYEVVSSVILNAVASGRRVVTNIAGINPEKIAEYLVEKRKCNREQLGEIITFQDDAILQENFFPDEKHPEIESVVKGGDLVCVDEIWRFWSKDNKITPNHMQFFRMHRHYTHPDTGVACDIAMMTQDASGVHPKILNVVEMTTLCTKLKAVGIPTHYRIELYEGKKVIAKARLDRFNKKYDKDIFPLYKSYSAGSGKESPMDKRQNILLNPRLWGTGILCLLAVTAGPYFVYRSLTAKTKPAVIAEGTPLKDVKATQQSSSGAQAAVMAPKPFSDSFSETWRISGHMTSNGQTWIVLANPAGRLRVESPSMFSNQGYAAIGHIDGQRVTVWTGVTTPTIISTSESRR